MSTCQPPPRRSYTAPPADLAAAAAEGLETNVRRFLAYRGIAPGESVELQALDVPSGGRWTSSRFAHADDAATVVKLLEEADGWNAPAVYIVANRVDPAVATRAAAGHWHEAKKGESTTDKEITARALLFIDVDAARPKGTSSTDAQVEATAVVAEAIASRLEGILERSPLARGEEDPRAAEPSPIAIGHSGNGRSVFVALADIPETPALAATVKGILAAVKELHEVVAAPGVQGVKIDASVSDAKRLLPAFGTVKRKGAPDVAERPHRRSSILCAAAPRRLDARELAAVLASLRSGLSAEAHGRVDAAMGIRVASPQRVASGPGATFDGPDVFRAAKEIPIDGVLAWLGLGDAREPVCPGCGLSGDSSVAVVGNGLKCSHERCSSLGVAGSPGFRTVIDIVCEAHGVEAKEAVELLADRFGTPRPGARPQTSTASAPRAKPAMKGPSEDGNSPAPRAKEPRLPTEQHTIRIVCGELPRIVREAIGALAENDSNLYQRSGGLVTITREPERAEAYDRDRLVGGDITLRPGTPRLRSIPQAVLTERLASAASWVRFDGRRGKEDADGKKMGAWVAADPHGPAVGIVWSRGDWPGIRPVRGILETPSLAPSGRVIDVPGYDEETGFVLLPSCTFPKVPDRPTQAEAAEALRYLWTELFSDFPYRGLGEHDPLDADRSGQFGRALASPDAFVALAALLSIFARPAILGAIPGAVFEAATQGSGKSLQMHVISMVATGRAAGVMTFPMRDGRADEPELEKVLSSYALAGARVIAFDNVKGSLGGPGLEKAMTAVDTIDLRVLGVSDLRTLPWAAAILFSGNNMTMSDDVAQRTIVSRIESPREDPRSRPARDFRHPELLGWIKANRPSLVLAALTILRAYFVAPADARTDCGTWGSFEAWSRLIPGAIAYAGGPNMLEARPTSDAGSQDEESAAHLTLMRSWPEAFKDAKAGAVVMEAFKHETEIARGKLPPDGLDDLRAAIRTLTRTPDGRTPNAVGFGRALRGLRGKIRSGFRLLGELDRNGVTLWRVQVPGE